MKLPIIFITCYVAFFASAASLEDADKGEDPEARAFFGQPKVVVPGMYPKASYQSSNVQNSAAMMAAAAHNSASSTSSNYAGYPGYYPVPAAVPVASPVPVVGGGSHLTSALGSILGGGFGAQHVSGAAYAPGVGVSGHIGFSGYPQYPQYPQYEIPQHIYGSTYGQIPSIPSGYYPPSAGAYSGYPAVYQQKSDRQVANVAMAFLSLVKEKRGRQILRRLLDEEDELTVNQAQ